MANSNSVFRNIAFLACGIALIVVVLGAYVRLSDAGLGCPDWPGCYGHLLGVPESNQEIDLANDTFPQRAVETDKAWKEMIHRYLAEALGLLILLLAFTAIIQRKKPKQHLKLPILLVGLVILQGLLGMWTVTLLLKPVIVMLHLLGGLTILSLLWWLVLNSPKKQTTASQQTLVGGIGLLPLIVVGLILLIGQIILGGWTSTNYAALACADFPTCQGQWWPETNFKEAFVFWRGLGTNYEFGVLDNPARTAIHLSHRIFAIVVAGYWFFTIMFALRSHCNTIRKSAIAVIVLLIAQIGLGISNIVFHLPIAVAVLHNAGAALLLLSVVTLTHYARSSAD